MPDVNEDILQKLASSIVEIISDKDSSTLGTGFVITDDGLVVTCRHVVIDSEDKLVNSVIVRFHSDSKTDPTDFTAGPLKGEESLKEDPSIDIAFLKLDRSPEKGVTPVKLDDKAVTLNRFASIGFKKAEEFTRLSAKGEIRIPTHIKISKDVLSPEVIQLYSPDNEIEPGMSGAPVLDLERDRVVGIITERYKEEYNPAAVSNMAFALPVTAMLDVYPMLREKNQGLTLLSKFLDAVGEKVESSIYKWIDEVYVPPNEFDEIKAALKRDRIVFITGTKEFGKTFTAVKLMYEFFKEEGYQPQWVKERKEQGRPEGSDPQQLVRIMHEEDYIKPHEIVYFEDPFGKTKYESYSDLESYIGNIIDSIKRVHDAYVIITSREEVFKQFKDEQDSFKEEPYSEVGLKNFEKQLNLKRASYSVEKKKEMLERWAKVYNCKWLLDTPLRDHVLDDIQYQQELLPTPMTIREFALASYDTIDKAQLDELMRQKSKATALRFGDEIMRMEDEKVLFLVFPYIGRIDIDLAKEVYDSIIPSLNQQRYPMDFNQVMTWFEGDKINVSEHRIEFSHPSYQEAFDHAIYGKGTQNKKVREIFSKVLYKLVDKDEVAQYLANRITRKPDRLPTEVIGTLLLKLAGKDSATSKNIAYELRYDFDKLSSKTREQLLIKLADNNEAVGSVAYAVRENFDRLPTEVIGTLLLKLADNDDAAGEIAITVEKNFDKLPKELREELLVKLADKHNAIYSVHSIIVENFDKLPSDIRQILFKPTDNNNLESYVINAVRQNLGKLPSETTKELLLKLIDKKGSVALWLAEIIVDNIDKLPSETTKELLLKLIEKGLDTGSVAFELATSFDKLPKELREELLVKLADNNEAVGSVAYAVRENFDKLPSNVREQLLIKLADDDKAPLAVAFTIAANFHNLPSNVQELLFKLADNDEAAENIAKGIEINFDNLPSNVREQLLIKLADKAAFEVARIIARNFHNLPSNVQELLFKLADNDDTVRTVPMQIIENFHNLPSNVQELLFKLADNAEAASEVAYAISMRFNNLPSSIREQLVLKLADKDKGEARSMVSIIIKEYSNSFAEDIIKEILTKLRT